MKITDAARTRGPHSEHVTLTLRWSAEAVHLPAMIISKLDGDAIVVLTFTKDEARDLETTLALLRTQPAALLEEATPPPPSMKADQGFSG